MKLFRLIFLILFMVILVFFFLDLLGELLIKLIVLLCFIRMDWFVGCVGRVELLVFEGGWFEMWFIFLLVCVVEILWYFVFKDVDCIGEGGGRLLVMGEVGMVVLIDDGELGDGIELVCEMCDWDDFVFLLFVIFVFLFILLFIMSVEFLGLFVLLDFGILECRE